MATHALSLRIRASVMGDLGAELWNTKTGPGILAALGSTDPRPESVQKESGELSKTIVAFFNIEADTPFEAVEKLEEIAAELRRVCGKGVDVSSDYDPPEQS